MESVRSQVIHVNSANRTSGTVNDFTVDLGNRFMAVDGARGRIRVCPVQVVINRSWYTVAEGLNDSFNLFDGTILTTVVLPSGFYNYKTLQTALKNLLPTFLVEWSLLTNRYRITPPNDGKTYTFYFTTPACELLGFNLGDEVDGTFESPIISPRPIRMNRESVVLVHANFPKEKFAAVDNVLTQDMRESDILVKLPVNKAPFDNLIWRVKHVDVSSFYLTTTSLSNVRFHLTDEYDRPLVPSYDWTMTIRVDYFRERSKLDEMQTSIDRIRDYLRYMVLSSHPPTSSSQAEGTASKKNLDNQVSTKSRRRKK